MEIISYQPFSLSDNSEKSSDAIQENVSPLNSNQGLPSMQAFNHLEEPSIISSILKEQKENNSKGDSESARIATKEKLKEFQIPAKWEWLPCNYELQREEKSIETYWSLTPTIQLVGNDQKNPSIVDISINLERSFIHNNEVGWNWHKSWNLPNLSVSIKIKDAISNETILPPADLKAQLFAVKISVNQSKQFKLFDLGLKGSTVQDLSEGQCTFSALKFTSTSYNNDGVKFHLITLIYMQDDIKSRAYPRILYSRISPPIFVDSRKSARDSNIVRKKTICKYFDPFPADTFEKTFIKRNSKFNESVEEVIENSLGGLLQYFTAPNIRNKVKHPIFLAAKFSNCVKLFYNANLVKFPIDTDENKEEDTIIMIQKILMRGNTLNEIGNPSKGFDNKNFILLVEEPENLNSVALKKKISEYLDPIVNDVLHIAFNSNFIPVHFRELPNKNLVTTYANVYIKLTQMRDAFISQPSTPEYTENPKKAKTNSQKSKTAKIKNGEINRKRGKQEIGSDNEDDEGDSEKTQASPNLGTTQKKVKTESDKISEKTKTMEEIIIPLLKPNEDSQLIKSKPLEAKTQQRIIIHQKTEVPKMIQPQKLMKPKPSHMKVENECVEINSELDDLSGSNLFSKIKEIQSAKGINAASLAKRVRVHQILQSAENLQVNKLGMHLSGTSTQYGTPLNGMSFGQSLPQIGNDSNLEFISNLPEQMKNQLAMNTLCQKYSPHNNSNIVESKSFSFGQQTQVPSQLQPQYGAQFMQISQLQNHQHFDWPQTQDLGKDQQKTSNDVSGFPLLSQLIMQQKMVNLLMGNQGTSSNVNFTNLLRGASSLLGGFSGIFGNNQGSSQVEGLMKGSNMNEMNMANLMANIGKLGGLQK